MKNNNKDKIILVPPGYEIPFINDMIEEGLELNAVFATSVDGIDSFDDDYGSPKPINLELDKDGLEQAIKTLNP